MEDMYGMKFRAFAPFCGLHELTLSCHKRDAEGIKVVTADMRLDKLNEVVSAMPFMTLKTDEAQSLMDALYGAGVRPSEGQGSAGMMKAVQAHLADVQKDKDWLKGRIK